MRTNTSITESVRRRVQRMEPGAAFATSEFLSMGSRASVDQALARLAREGVIRRVRRGIYDCPRTSVLLGTTLGADPEEAVKAYSKRSAMRVQVAGAQAANALGLTTQVPARIVYLTDGASKRIDVGSQIVEFRHTSPRNMATAGRISGTVIQALRYLGKRNVTSETVDQLRSILRLSDKLALKRDSLYAPAWMRPFLMEIAEGCARADATENVNG